jgi:hypothetical protein
VERPLTPADEPMLPNEEAKNHENGFEVDIQAPEDIIPVQ